jgi:hypothetical protein
LVATTVTGSSVTAALGVAALCGWISCANTPTAPAFIKAIVDTPSSSARASRQAAHDTAHQDSLLNVSLAGGRDDGWRAGLGDVEHARIGFPHVAFGS